MMVNRTLAVTACGLGALYVLLGAFAAHGAGPQIKTLLTTGAHYGLIHALLAVVAAVVARRSRLILWAGWLAAMGGAVFALSLTLVGLADRAGHKPNELSGGQEQRVAIARALVTDPTLLVCDEPTGDLDRKTADEILGLLQVLNREHGKTIIMVTHDPKAADFATHTVHLDKGLLAEAGAH